jgi:hypothetical protein
MEKSHMVTETAPQAQASPPYIAFRTLQNLIERMANEGIPGRIDSTYLDNLAGGYQAQVFSALRSLGLMGEDRKPLGPLTALVTQKDRREELMGELVNRVYPYAVVLGEDATHGQLEEAFRDNAPNLGTHAREKAITFYMHAAKYAKLPLSKHFKGISTSSSPKAPRRRVARTRENQLPLPTPPAGNSSSDEQRKDAYFKLLIDLAASAKEKGEVQKDILDRLERLLPSQQGGGGI